MVVRDVVEIWRALANRIERKIGTFALCAEMPSETGTEKEREAAQPSANNNKPFSRKKPMASPMWQEAQHCLGLLWPNYALASWCLASQSARRVNNSCCAIENKVVWSKTGLA